MGSIRALDLKGLVKKYELKAFIETGTGYGDSVAFALEQGFEYIASCEIDEETYRNAEIRFRGVSPDQLELWWTDSIQFLRDTGLSCPHRALFFLDAHFPGCYRTHRLDFAVPHATPLVTEIETLLRVRDISKDVLVLDDMRLYIEAEYENGDTPDLRERMPVGGFEEIKGLLSPTHTLLLSPKDEGYLICLPK